MAQLTPKQFVKELEKRSKLLKKNLPLQIAAQSVHALRVNRVFHEGLDSNNSQIGNYATSPEVWIENDYHRRGGNNGGKSGRAKKTSYYKSYAAFKKSQGFGSNIVLRQTNRLQSDFANRQISPNSDGLPKSKPIKVNNNKYIERITSENVDKIKGREHVFNFSAKEKKLFNKVFNETAVKILNGQTRL
jgi:hypothetical protein